MANRKTQTAKLRRALTALIGGLAIMGVAATASAINADDVRNLQASGLAPSVIVSVIQSSDSLEMTDADVEALRAEGFDPMVLDAICVRIGCAVSGGPTNGGGSGVGPSLDQEYERQRQLEEERRRLEEQRLQQQRDQMRQQIEQEDRQAVETQQRFDGLSRADRMMRRGEYLEAATLCQGFIDEVQPLPTSSEYQTAQACYVEAMYEAGFRHVIADEALEVVLFGSNTDHFEAGFDRLVEISNDVAFYSPQFEDLVSLSVANYDDDFQDEYNYFLGRFFWVYGEFGRAHEMFSRMDDNADQRAAAHYVQGVMYLDEGELTNASRSFQDSVVVGTRNGNDDVVELGYMALARMTAEVNAFDAALYYYNKIPTESYRHATALYESMWAYLMKFDWNRTIGAVHTLRSPYYADHFHAELSVVEAATYLSTCNLDAAEDALMAFDEEIRPLQEEVAAFVNATASPQEYWAAMDTYYDRYDTSDPVALPIEAVRYVMSDMDYVEIRELIEQLRAERALLEGMTGELDEAQALIDQIDFDLQGKEIDAGLRISNLIINFNAEITDWTIKASEVGIEITTARLDQVRAVSTSGIYTGDVGTTIFVLAQDWQYWPFEGEYWADEVDNFRGDLPMLRDPDTGTCVATELPL